MALWCSKVVLAMALFVVEKAVSASGVHLASFSLPVLASTAA